QEKGVTLTSNTTSPIHRQAYILPSAKTLFTIYCWHMKIHPNVLCKEIKEMEIKMNWEELEKEEEERKKKEEERKNKEGQPLEGCVAPGREENKNIMEESEEEDDDEDIDSEDLSDYSRQSR